MLGNVLMLAGVGLLVRPAILLRHAMPWESPGKVWVAAATTCLLLSTVETGKVGSFEFNMFAGELTLLIAVMVWERFGSRTRPGTGKRRELSSRSVSGSDAPRTGASLPEQIYKTETFVCSKLSFIKSFMNCSVC
jgi:hypothetical protein